MKHSFSLKTVKQGILLSRGLRGRALPFSYKGLDNFKRKKLIEGFDKLVAHPSPVEVSHQLSQGACLMYITRTSPEESWILLLVRKLCCG